MMLDVILEVSQAGVGFFKVRVVEVCSNGVYGIPLSSNVYEAGSPQLDPGGRLWVPIEKKAFIFHVYGSDNPISLEELQKLAAEGDEIIARAEFSGSEGCYVEVCRWNPATRQYERFCFEKVFGGELGD